MIWRGCPIRLPTSLGYHASPTEMMEPIGKLIPPKGVTEHDCKRCSSGQYPTCQFCASTDFVLLGYRSASSLRRLLAFR